MKYNKFKKEIEILKNFKNSNPWSGEYQEKKDKFKQLLFQLCKLYKISSPRLLIPKNSRRFKWTRRMYGDCNFVDKKIRIKNFSIITLLHEFKHWLDGNLDSYLMKDRKKREWEAVYYSTTRFYSVWPERISYLEEILNKKKLNIKKNKNTDPSVIAILDLVGGKLKC